MSAPLLKDDNLQRRLETYPLIQFSSGLLITASVLVAAGVAIYENEEIRRLIEEYRRRVADAFYSMGDNISPNLSGRSPGRPGEGEDLSRKRRDEIVMRNRAELVRQARAEGIAVDLDQLTALGLLDEKAIEHGAYKPPHLTAPTISHDRAGNSNETCNKPDASKSSAIQHSSDHHVRYRGDGARGFYSGAAWANPFDDSEVMFDRHIIGPVQDELPSSSSTNLQPKIASLSPRPMTEEMFIPDQKSRLIDIPVYSSDEAPECQPQSSYKTDAELDAEIEEAIRLSLANARPDSTDSDTLENESDPRTPCSDSLFDPYSPRDHVFDSAHIRSQSSNTASSVEELLGTDTPTNPTFLNLPSTDSSELMLNVDERSEAGETNDSFSEIGASTPGSWTDVDTDGEPDTDSIDDLRRVPVRQFQG